MNKKIFSALIEMVADSTLYSVSFVISTLRIVYISLKKAINSSFVAVTVDDGASHTNQFISAVKVTLIKRVFEREMR